MSITHKSQHNPLTHSNNTSKTTVQGDDVLNSFANLSVKGTIGKNKNIFGDDGFIRFPKTDLKAKKVPKAVANSAIRPDYIYDYVEDSEECETALKWKAQVGFMLAVYFDVPNPESWRLASFPIHYIYIKRSKRISPASLTPSVVYNLYHEDKVSAFQTPNEFFVHAIWLLKDASLDKKNCECIRCLRTDKWKTIVKGPYEKWKATKTSPAPSGKSQIKADTFTFQRPIIAQRTPAEDSIPGVPLSKTINQRDSDLDHFKDTVSGKSEGYRLHEYVFYHLKEPIRWKLGEEEMEISLWPAIVVRHQLVSVRVEQGSPTNRIKQTSHYQIKLMGTDEKLSVQSNMLMPGLQGMATIKEILELNCGVPSIKDKQPLNLGNGKPRPPIENILHCFKFECFFIQALQQMFTFVTPFKNIAGVEKPERRSSLAESNRDEAKNTKSVGFTNTEGQKNNCAYGEEDEDSNKRRRASLNVGPSTTTTKSVLHEDTNDYFEGLFLGLEMIWVGDLVRLRLTDFEVRQMMQNLLERKCINIPKDKKEADLQSSFVLRIKAIYRTPSDDSFEKMRIVGDVYRVVNKEDSIRSEQEYNARAKENAMENIDELSEERASTGSTWNAWPSSSSPTSPNGISFRSSSSSCALMRILKSFGRKWGKKMPQSPLLPSSFAYQLVNIPQSEVVFSVYHLAGRFYPSIGSKGPESELISEVRRQSTIQQMGVEDDMRDEKRLRLALAGYLPGIIHAMGGRDDIFYINSRKSMGQDARKLANDKILEISQSLQNHTPIISTIATLNNSAREQASSNSCNGHAQLPTINTIAIDLVSDDEDDVEIVSPSSVLGSQILRQRNASDHNARSEEEKIMVSNLPEKRTREEDVEMEENFLQNVKKPREQDDVEMEEENVLQIVKKPRELKPKPTNLPDGWKAKLSKSQNRWFYVNTKTNETTWKLPS